MKNEEIARIFYEIADLLDLAGDRFRPEVYRRAARTLEGLPEDLGDLAARGKLREIPGIGEALAEKIDEYLRTGKVAHLEKLRSETPPGLRDLLRLDGVGPKTARRLFRELGIQGLEDLDRALKEGTLSQLEGFRERKVQKLKESLERARRAPSAPGSSRLSLPEAEDLARETVRALRSSGAPVAELMVAGSLRRRKETIGDLDIVATSARPREVMEAFTHLPAVGEVLLHGETRSTVRLTTGFQVDLRVVPPEAFGAALVYFTGSKDHNIRLRSRGIQLGVKINEYGLTRNEVLVPAPREEAVYRAVDLPWIPPEIRENQGEVEAAEAGTLPPLLPENGSRAELHIHVPSTVGAQEIREWTRAAQEHHLTAVGFVVRADELRSGEIAWSALRATAREVSPSVHVVWGLEGTLGKGHVPFPPENETPDYLVATLPETPPRGTRWLSRDLAAWTARRPTLLGHLGRAVWERAGLRWEDLERLEDVETLWEIGVGPHEVGLESHEIRSLAQRRVRWVVSGLPRQPAESGRIRLAEGLARRGWVPMDSVANADPLPPWVQGTERNDPGGG